MANLHDSKQKKQGINMTVHIVNIFLDKCVQAASSKTKEQHWILAANELLKDGGRIDTIVI